MKTAKRLNKRILFLKKAERGGEMIKVGKPIINWEYSPDLDPQFDIVKALEKSILEPKATCTKIMEYQNLENL